MSSTEAGHPARGSAAMAIANLVVRLMSEYTGRGPTKARAYVHDDFISVVLQDLLTKGERSLVRDGRLELVLAARRAYQQTMSQDMIEGIEQITGQRVIAFLSDNHIDPDCAVESFILEPREGVFNDGFERSDGDGGGPFDG